MAKRVHRCDVPGCGTERTRWQRLCTRCFTRLPGEMRTGIIDAHHQHRDADWRRLRKAAAVYLGFANLTSKIPPTQQHRVPLARVIELQQRLLGERTDA
ncbi:MAG: hypothetical protein WCS75_01385 [Sphingomonas sp.]|uniref:hypothetical protein n=1 Tax=Sphingomonas sp. TaxID=28214 RepID=UPI0035634366